MHLKTVSTYLVLLDFLGVEVVLLPLEELVGEAVQVRCLLQVHTELVDILTGLSEKLVDDGYRWRLETQAELDGVRRNEASRG